MRKRGQQAGKRAAATEGAMAARHGTIRIGVGGWTFEPWRGDFYPKGLPQRRELEFMSRRLTSIEINATFYGTQKRSSFIRWREETPDDFMFALKGPRYATNRRVLAKAGDSISRFIDSGVLDLGPKLGPIFWQFAPTKKFDAADFAAFLKLLPKTIDGQSIRHAVELRHESFRQADAIRLLREHEVALVVAGDSKFPLIADVTAPFVYARIMGTSAKVAAGYRKPALQAWVSRIRNWAVGASPADLDLISKSARKTPRDVFLYVISGHKAHNPAAAAALIAMIEK